MVIGTDERERTLYRECYDGRLLRLSFRGQVLKTLEFPSPLYQPAFLYSA
jgi:hypothetical protein